MKKFTLCCFMFLLCFSVIAQRLQKIGQLTSDFSAGCWDFMNNVEDAISMNGIAYFSADDGIHGAELWRSDGTEAGTWMVKDIYSSIFQAPSRPHNFFVHKNEVYFSAFNESGAELWKTDGTTQGTVMVADINPNGNAGPYPFASYNNELYLLAYTDATGMDVWKYNGQNVTPFEVVPGTNGLAVSYSPEQNYWSSTDLELSFEFDGWLYISSYRTDGQAIQQVVNKNNQSFSFQSHIVIGSKLYVYSNSGSLDFYTLNVGENQFTKFTWAIPNITNYGYRSGPFELNGKLYFVSYFYADVNDVQKGFFSFDGQQIILEFEFPESSTEIITKLHQRGNDCFILRKNGDEKQIWKFDGNSLTHIATPWIVNDPYNQYKRYNLIEYNGKIYWTGRINGNDELWSYDLASQTASEIEFNGNNKSIYLLKDNLVTNSGLLLLSNGDQYSHEPRIINQNNTNPILVKDINSSFITSVLKFTPYRNHLYYQYVGLNRINENGEMESNLGAIQPYIANQESSTMFVVNDKLIFFSSSSTDYGIEPCAWNGAESILLADIYNGPNDGALISSQKGGNMSSSQGSFVNPLPEVINDVLVFVGDDGNSRTLWRTDGTPTGTFKIDLANFSIGSIYQFLKVDNLIYFKTTGAQPKQWATDGTAAWEITESIPSLNYRYYAYVNDSIFGNNMLQTQPFEISFTDGLHGSSQIIQSDIYTGQYKVSSYGWKSIKDKVFFVAKTNQYGSELWTSDGSNAAIIKDIVPGSASSFDDYPSAFFKDYSFFSNSDSLFFISKDKELGHQLWKTAGTQTSTEMLTELEWGDAIGLTYWRGKLFFIANNGGIYSYKIYPDEAQLTITNQETTYDGTAKQIEFNTNLPLSTLVLYDGKTELPLDAGTYSVTIESLNPDVHLFEETTFVIQKAIQQITISPIDDVIDAQAGQIVLVDAAANTNLPLELEVLSGPAEILNGQLTLTGEAGTVMIKLKQSGTINYLPIELTTDFDVQVVMSSELEIDTFLKVYPNPSLGSIKIESQNQIDSYQLIDMNGKKLFESESPFIGVKVFDVQQKGVYLLKIKSDSKTSYIRIVIH